MITAFPHQIWELAEGQLLFDGTWTPNDPYTPEAHLAQMTAVLGAVPGPLLARSRNRDRYFDADGMNTPSVSRQSIAVFLGLLLIRAGNLLKTSPFPPCSLEQFSRNPDLSDPEKKAFLNFIKSMISLDPDQRLDTSKLLESAWLG